MTQEDYAKIERLGKYKILAEVGRGGMARVFRAEDTETGLIVAIKALLPELAGQPAFVKRFRREIETLRGLDHPAIVKILDREQDGLTEYYVMEYMDGPTVDKQLRLKGKFAVPEALSVTKAVATALEYAHAKGLIHRDIKPANIMTQANGIVKLTDFGIAQDVDATRLTVTGGIVGTADFMSPEQAEGRRVTRKSDIYSLGVCLYEMLTGRLPFVGKTYLDVIRAHRFSIPDSVRSVNPAVPGRLARLVESMMEKDPEKRISSAGEVIAAMNAMDATADKLTDEERESAREMVQFALMPAHDWKIAALKVAGIAALAVITVLAATGIRYRYFTTAEYKYQCGLAQLRKGNYTEARSYFEHVEYFHSDSSLSKAAEDRISEILYKLRKEQPATTTTRLRVPNMLGPCNDALDELTKGNRQEAILELRRIADDYGETEGGRKAAAKLQELAGKDTARDIGSSDSSMGAPSGPATNPDEALDASGAHSDSRPASSSASGS